MRETLRSSARVLFAKRKWLWKRDDTNQKQKEKLRIMLPNEKNANAEKTVKGAVTFIMVSGTLYQLDSCNGFWIIFSPYH